MRNVERAIFRPSAEHANPRGVCDFFADVFSALDERPHSVEVEIDFSDATPDDCITLDLQKGEPVLIQPGNRTAHGRFHGRWLAEHPVPLALCAPAIRFWLVPTSGNRVKVRLARRTLPGALRDLLCAAIHLLQRV